MREQFSTITYLRLLIGILGEKDHFSWWPSAFFTQGSHAFLDPIFPRTRLLAQCNGVTRAAALVHDERIGVGQTYHLFRLPEEMEQAIHRALQDPALATQFPGAATRDDLLARLEQLAVPVRPDAVGPVRVGSRQDMNALEKWRQVAGLYFHGFKSNNTVFPYFS
ncbi:BrxE family protein [Candidatus Parcubacteria bacterium]|nr:MAG: BrxE family protein [Candidatus Parcubacteria bacterium]